MKIKAKIFMQLIFCLFKVSLLCYELSLITSDICSVKKYINGEIRKSVVIDIIEISSKVWSYENLDWKNYEQNLD